MFIRDGIEYAVAGEKLHEGDMVKRQVTKAEKMVPYGSSIKHIAEYLGVAEEELKDGEV